MKFSIIIPTYNRVHTIERALNSILKQTYQHFEMIVIDDGSTDNTEEIVRKYLNDARIKFIGPNKNGGVNVARNIGLKNIADDSNWVTFLDSDDEFLPDALENMKKTIENNLKYNYFRFAVIYDNGVKPCYAKYDGIVLDYEATLKQKDASGEWVCTLSRKILDDGFKFEEKVNGFEGLAWFELSKKENCVYSLSVVRLYKLDAESVFRIKNKKWYENYRDGSLLHLKRFGKDLKVYSKKEYAKKLYALGNTHIILGDYVLGFQDTYDAFKIDPLNTRVFRNILTFFNFKRHF